MYATKRQKVQSVISDSALCISHMFPLKKNPLTELNLHSISCLRCKVCRSLLTELFNLHTFIVGGLILVVGAVRPAAPATSQPTKFLAGNHWALLPALPTAPTQHDQPSALVKKICWRQAAKHGPLEKPQEQKVHVKQQRKMGDREILDAAL